MRREHPASHAARIASAIFLLAGAAAAQAPAPPPLSPAGRSALDRISADSLRGHLSFLASDLLAGRDTPSPGLDIAAEYIAAQFRRAGLEPAGDDGYFQTARWNLSGPDPAGFALDVEPVAGKPPIRVPVASVRVDGSDPVDLSGLGTYKLPAGTRPEMLDAVPAEQVAGRAVWVEAPEPAANATLTPRTDRARFGRTAVAAKLAAMKAALLVVVDRDPAGGLGLGGGRLLDPEAPAGRMLRMPGSPIPTVVVHDPRGAAFYDAMPAGAGSALVSYKIPEPDTRPVVLRNVVGLLRGSDPGLSNTYVMVTSHYDHIGVGRPVNGDRINNGANDDGSGTVSVVEIASALAGLPAAERPKRSILFCTFFGEEKGLLGSRYYGRHPVVPVAATVADLNLEQVGRTDDVEGPQVNRMTMTGMDYSEVGPIVRAAGRAEGVDVYKHPRNSDAFFARSDNQALADLGVPAHTIGVAFVFPDYHGVGDHWEKVDYPNMARVDRAIARALLTIADDPRPPSWDAANPKAAKYLDAWKKLHP